MAIVGGSERRLQAFDAARGIAVLFMCLSHFVGVYFRNPTFVQRIVMSVCMVASPTFIILSGVMLGFLTTNGEESLRRLRFKLTDRAIFLLTITHVLITLSMWSTENGGSHGWMRSTITDAVAVAILAALWLPRRPRLRVVIGVLGLAASWFFYLRWHPTDMLDVGLKELMFGAPSFQLFNYSWPVVPWASAYIIFTVLGEMMGRHRREPMRMVKLGYVAAACSLTGAALWPLVGRWIAPMHHVGGWALEPIFSPWAKFPPSPEYFFAFGGVALVMIATVLWCGHRGWLDRASREAARIGRCSLVLFVAQSFLYYTVVDSLALPNTAAWPVIFLFTLIPLYVLAYFWDREHLNRFLSVGLERPLAKLMTGRQAAIKRTTAS